MKSIKNIKTKTAEYIKSGFFKGVGLGAGLLTTSLFAAAAAINVFAPGEVISSTKINENFAIAAPEGAVMAFFLASCPNGWAPADGTNGTPDLRGRFIRGLDDAGTGAAGADPSGVRALGNEQLDAFQGHRMGAPNGGAFAVSQPQPTLVFDAVSGGSFSPTTGDPVTDGVNGTPRTSSETRPRNVALIYCMRKN
ncbi:MAG: phage tail protein [bacterium]|nr:phage tail protein [bacterium]